MHGPLARWKERVAALHAQVVVLYLACRDPRVPLLAKVIAGLVVAYVLSPIDLIPDFIPVLGYVDDLFLVPLGLMLAYRLIPETILAEHRAEAQRHLGARPRSSLLGAGLVILIWSAILVWAALAIRESIAVR
jgi:uncharacterized membrane protein YkvA (DUF1232 family)